MCLIALGLQALLIYSEVGQGRILPRALFVLSYLLLFVFVWANRRHLGLLIIGIGLLLNFLAIVTNGGLMPVSPDTLERAGLEERMAALKLGEPIPLTKNLLLEREDTRLWFLSDILVWDNPANIRAFSVGDVIIGVGLAVTLANLFLPRPRRTSLGPSDSPSSS